MITWRGWSRRWKKFSSSSSSSSNMSSLLASLLLLCTGQSGLTRSRVDAGEEGRETVEDLNEDFDDVGVSIDLVVVVVVIAALKCEILNIEFKDKQP